MGNWGYYCLHETLDQRAPHCLPSMGDSHCLGGGDCGVSEFGRPLLDAFFSSLFWVVIMGCSAHFTSGRLRRTASELEAHGQVLAYIRYPNSLPGSLSGIGNRGIATRAQGKWSFSPLFVKADIEVAATPASQQKILDLVVTPREPEDTRQPEPRKPNLD
jgi:hypothetical protein